MPTGILIVTSATAVTTATRSPTITFAAPYKPVANDVIVASFAATTVIATVTPAGWAAAASVSSDSNTQNLAVYTINSTDATAGTLTYTATNIWNTVATGSGVAIIVRGLEMSGYLDEFASGFSSVNTATPHVIPALPTTVLNYSLVVGILATPTTNTWTDPAGWTLRASLNTNIANSLWTRDLRTTAGVAVASTNVTPTTGDEYCGWAVALQASTTAPGYTRGTGINRAPHFRSYAY